MASSSTHKRTSSAAGNIASTPAPKRQEHEGDAKETATSIPSSIASQYVYVVMIDSDPQYGDSASDVHGIYASIKDANNAVKYLANDHGGELECDIETSSDGRISWSCRDIGEGDSATLRVERMRVKPEGSEPEREWRDFSKDD